MIDLYIALSILIFTAGDYKQRVQCEHDMIQSSVSYANVKTYYQLSSDPEVKFRLKRALWAKWCVITDEKYRVDDSYQDNSRPLNKLQEFDFIQDIK